MNYLQSVLIFSVVLTKISGSTEYQDLLSIISSSLRSESSKLPEQISSEPPTTEQPILLDQISGEIPDTAQYDSLPTKKPKFISVFAGNISFENGQNLTYYAELLRKSIPPQHQLEYLEAISDRMRQENKFQVEEWLHEFASLFYLTLNTHKNLALQPWSKKTERKIVKRFLKYAVASESFSNKTISIDASCENLQPFKFMGKQFYRSLLSLSEEEGYEILMDILQNRNVTLTPGQLQDLQCLYYNSFQGMENGRAYIFSEFDDDWDRRNGIFGKPVILHSIRVMVQEEAGISEDANISDFMQKIFSAFPEYRSKLEEEKKTGPKKTPKKFHDVVSKLERKLMGVGKSDIFIDADSKDIVMSTGVEALLDLTSDVFDPDKSPIVFDPFSRHDWNQLQKLRWAGLQIFDKYDKFFARIVKNKITEIYQGRGLSRTFSNAFHHIRLLPTGPLILQGFETLNDLMEQTPPRDNVTHATRITNFKQTLQFLRGLHSTNDAVLSTLPQQVQILTDPNLNKNLKLILKFSPAPQLAQETSKDLSRRSSYTSQTPTLDPEVSGFAPETSPFTPEKSQPVPDNMPKLTPVKPHGIQERSPVIPGRSQDLSKLSHFAPEMSLLASKISQLGPLMSRDLSERPQFPMESSQFGLLRSWNVPKRYQTAPDTSNLSKEIAQRLQEMPQLTPGRSKRSSDASEIPPVNSQLAPPPSTEPVPNDEDMIFMEVGVSAGSLTLKPFPYIPIEDNKAPFVNSWQFQLGYFKGYSEAWQDPVIKAGIILVNETKGGLSYSWSNKMMTYEKPDIKEAKVSGFWDLSVLPNGQSFQLMYQGKVETSFSVLLDSTGMLPLGIKGEQHVPYNFLKKFRPAEFFVMPSDDFY